MAKGQVTSGAPGHLGEQKTLLDWTLGSHGHLVGGFPEAWDILSHFLEVMWEFD